MSARIPKVKIESHMWLDDIWGGVAAMLVALPSSIAFGVLVYTALGPEYVSQGAMAGIIGAAALGLVTPFIGRTNGLISAPCAPSAAVLSALVLSLIAGEGLDAASIPSLLALTILLSSLFQILYGVVGGGRLIKFVPFPVVSGYLSGVGVLIALGQIPKILGLPKDTFLIRGILSPEIWKWQGLVVGLVTMIIMGFAPRITKKIPSTILGLLGGMTTYFILASFSPHMLTLTDNPLVIGPINTSGSLVSAVADRVTSLFVLDIASIKLILIPALTLSVLLSIDTLKTCVVLDALTRNRHKSDRELMGQGIGNFTAFLTGGIPGAGTMGPTLVNVNSGGRSYRSAVVEGISVVMAFLILGKLIAWVPIGALAGILLVTAWLMIDKTMFRLLRHPAGRLDFAVIAVVILVAVTVDLIAASGVGVFLSIMLFIRDQIRGSVIRRKRYLNHVSSKTRRLAEERELLNKYGDQGVLCELQGNLFFGTTDQLFTQLEDDLKTKRYILFNMRRVQSIDYTAVHLFEQIQVQLEERGGQLLVSGMPTEQKDFKRYLSQLGIVGVNEGVMINDTIDGALEWIEERILENSGYSIISDDKLLDVKDIELFRELDEETIKLLTNCMRELLVTKGQKVVSQGDTGDEIFFVRRGSVQIILPLEGGKRHHLATIGPGDFFGDLSFLDEDIRSADVEAKIPTDLYVLSRSRFNEQVKSDVNFGVQVLARLAVAISERLRQTDAELRILEEH